MIFVSFPTAELKETPSALQARLRTRWFNPGVHVILEGVNLQTFDTQGQPVSGSHEEHLLVGFEGDASLAQKLPKLLADWGLPLPLLWDPSSVYEAVQRATAFYTKDGVNWERMYQALNVAQMHWYWGALDPDLNDALERLELTRGTFIDLGTGPGTQAIALAKRGFSVTATDISQAAVRKAEESAVAQGLAIRFLCDDILRSQVMGQFDYALDRGLLHIIPSESRGIYVRTVARLLRPGGILFLKTFSARQAGGRPYRFTSREIEEVFGHSFHLESTKETVMHGTGKPLPLALFSVLRRVSGYSEATS